MWQETVALRDFNPAYDRSGVRRQAYGPHRLREQSVARLSQCRRFFASGERTRQVLWPKGHNGGLTPQIADFINIIDPTRTWASISMRCAQKSYSK
jgi:hypothetical protein